MLEGGSRKKSSAGAIISLHKGHFAIDMQRIKEMSPEEFLSAEALGGPPW